MKNSYSYNWLQSFFSQKLPTITEFEEEMLKKSFEVENIEKKDDDWLIELDITPNRGECLSHFGMSEEISAVFGLKMKKKYFTTKVVNNKKGDFIKTDNCLRYSITKIENLDLNNINKTILQYFKTIKQNTFNPVVDYSNFFQKEIGQPTHAFDASKVSGDFNVRQARKGETLILLGAQEINLREEDVVIVDAKLDKPIALAGVKGGEETKVDENTKDIYLEIATFNPRSIRDSARFHNIDSDSARQYSQGYRPELLDYTIKEARELYSKLGNVLETKDEIKEKLIINRKTGIEVKEVNDLLGTKLDDKQIENILTNLNFNWKKVNSLNLFLEILKEQVGKPYKYGASVAKDAPDYFDCSSLISYCSACCGKSIPRISINQYLSLKDSEVLEKDIKKGDLMFFSPKDRSEKFYTESLLEQGFPVYKSKEKIDIDHIAVYLGNGEVLQAYSKEGGVVMSKLDDLLKVKEKGPIVRLFDEGDKRYVIESPIWRDDLKHSFDVIEEIGRIYGYELIESKEIKELSANKDIENEYKKRITIAKILQELDFCEIITYSFENKGDVCVKYPVAKDKGCLRKNLKKQMQDSLDRNSINGELFSFNYIRLFEIGSVFYKEENKIKEEVKLCIGLKNIYGRAKENFKEIKETIAGKLNIESKLWENDILEVPISQISIPLNDDMFLSKKNIDYKEYSKYPFCLRDISVFIPPKDEKDLFNLIKDIAGDDCVNIKLLDKYEKGSMTSFSYRLVFQSSSKTLSDDDVNLIMNNMYSSIDENKGWESR